jgi:hypothetical protein
LLASVGVAFAEVCKALALIRDSVTTISGAVARAAIGPGALDAIRVFGGAAFVRSYTRMLWTGLKRKAAYLPGC